MTTINIVRIAKVIALLAFILPWVAVSCSIPGQGSVDIATASGIELIQGKMTANPDAEKQMTQGMGGMFGPGAQPSADAVSMLAFFAGNPMALQHGMHCISWIVALAIPLQMLFLHLAVDRSDLEPLATPAAGGMLLASLSPPVLFLFVVLGASWQFSSQLAHARNLVANHPSVCVEREGLFEGWATSFDDPFGYFEYEYLATGPSRYTKKVVLEHGLCRELCRQSAGSEESFFELERPPGTDGAPTRTRCPLKNLLE